MNQCSVCGMTNTREKQRYCHECHARYMRAWRKDRPRTLIGEVAGQSQKRRKNRENPQ